MTTDQVYPSTALSGAPGAHGQETTPSERLIELGEIMGAGLQRALARKSSRLCDSTGESSLHLSPHQSGHAAPENRRMSDA